MKQVKEQIAKILLLFLVPILTSFPITNFTNRLIDKLIVMSGK